MSFLASGHAGFAIAVLTVVLWLWFDSLVLALLTGGPLGWLWLRSWVEGPVYQSSRRLEGKVVVVTGANAGIGLYTAEDLAARGAKVILACRNLEKGEEAVKWIKEQTGGLAKVECHKLDLASFKTVREFAQGLASRESKLDILVNNAGIAFTERTITEDGNELIFQTNHLANFLLTNLLLDLLKVAGKSRVVTVSSMGHRWLKDGIQFEDLKWEEKSWSSMKAYNQSKLANIYFMRELAVKTRGTGICTYSLSPGIVNTEIGRNLRNKIPSFLLPLADKAKLFMKNPESGAQTSIYCCVEQSLQEQSGRYYSDCAEKEVAKVALDAKASGQLWTVSANLVGDLTPVSPGSSFSITRESMSMMESSEGMGGVLMSQSSQTIDKIVKRRVVTTVTRSGGQVQVEREDRNEHNKVEAVVTKDDSDGDQKEKPIVTKDDTDEDKEEIVMVTKDDRDEGQKEKDIIKEDSQGDPEDNSSSSSSSEDDEKVSVL